MELHRRKSPDVRLTSASVRTKIEPSPNAAASAAPLQDTQAGHLRGRSASQCFGQGAETGTARKVRLTCFRVLKRQHEVDPGSEEHTSELQSLMRISYAVSCLHKKT